MFYTKMELLEAIHHALKKDPDFPHYGCLLDHGDKEFRITIVDTQQHFIIQASEIMK